MKRRIVVAIVLVAGLAVTAFGIPLGLVIDREFESQALLNLERAAILAERDIPTGWRPGDELTLDRATGDIRFGVYDANGVLVSGEGPTNGDEAVRTALEDRVGEAEVDNADVITVPITDGPVVGVLRAAQPLAATDRRVRAAWASMGLLAFAVIAGAVILAGRLARRISVPIEALHANAATLGTDALAPPLPSSGMAEIDDVAGALEHAARRVEESVQRERLFSAAVSHQLRTPITALRLLVDTELAAPRADPAELLHEAAGAVTRARVDGGGTAQPDPQPACRPRRAAAGGAARRGGAALARDLPQRREVPAGRRDDRRSRRQGSGCGVAQRTGSRAGRAVGQRPAPRFRPGRCVGGAGGRRGGRASGRRGLGTAQGHRGCLRTGVVGPIRSGGRPRRDTTQDRTWAGPPSRPSRKTAIWCARRTRRRNSRCCSYRPVGVLRRLQLGESGREIGVGTQPARP